VLIAAEDVWWVMSASGKILCAAKTRSGSFCKKFPIDGKKRCRLHGGLSLSGKSHWNYQHGHCTKEYRRATAEGNARVKLLERLAISLGMIVS
jgi:hypothetical protein